MRWLMARKVGRVRLDAVQSRWYVDLGDVRFDGHKQPRRLRIYSVPGLGAIQGHEMANSVLDGIRADLLNQKTLQQAVSRYLGSKAPENSIRRHWGRMIEKKARRTNRRPVGTKRLDELRSYFGRGYFRFFEGVSIFDISTPLLDDWLDWMDEEFPKLKPKTVKNVLDDIGTFLRWLRDQGDLSEVPNLPELPLGELLAPKIPDEDTLAAYIEAIPELKRGLFLVRSYNGLRPSEARALNVQDYDFRKDILTLRHTKRTGRRGKAALVPIPADWEVAEWVHRWVDPKDALVGYLPLFRNSDSYNDHARWTPSSERRVHLTACTVIGTYFKPNEVGRKACATHALRRTRDIHSVQKLLRHADPRTTERYAKLADDALVRVLRPRQERHKPV